MITFNSNHLKTIHQQAHASRDLLIETEIVDNVPTKTAWLNIFAQALRYRDWGELNHLSASFATSQCFEVITPENLPNIAKCLREQIGEANVTGDMLESILLSVATPEERALNGVSESFSIEGPSTITLIFEPEPFYAQPLLAWLLIYGKTWLPIGEIEQMYLAEIKRKRRGLSRVEAKAEHLDVYPNSGQRVPDILKKLEADRLVEFSQCHGKDNVRISDIGIDLLIEQITDNYGPKWQEWWRELRTLIKAEPYMSLKEDWTGYVDYFGEGGSPKDYIKAYSPVSFVNPHTAQLERGYQALTKQPNLPLHPSGKYIHLMPRLYLGLQHQSYKCSELQLEINGPNWLKIPAYKLKRCWPNSRYIGLMGDMIGFISELPDSISEFDVEYTWTSINKEFPIVSQKITYKLDADLSESDNWLYSTETGLNRVNRTDAFSSYSALTNGKKLATAELKELPRVKGTMAKLEFTDAGKRIRIEDVHHLTLSNQFEIHL